MASCEGDFVVRKLAMAGRFGGIGASVLAMSLVAACSSSGSGSGGSSSGGSSDGGSGSASSVSGQTITVYSGQHEETTQALTSDFQKRTGVTVKLKSNDEASLAGQLLQEGSASPADVFYAENPPALTTVQAKGLLAPVDKSTLAQVPAADSSTQGDWVAVSARTAAFAVNTSVPAAELPSSVYDLTTPAWKGKLGVAPSETDFSPIVTEIIKAKGTDAAKTWLEGLKANGKVYDSNETMIAAIDKGEIDGGIVDHYYWYRLRDEVGATKVHSALHYFKAGDPGAFIDVSGAGVLTSSKHKAAAQAFLAYLVSEPAQTIIATSHSYEYPLRPGVQSTTNLKPLDSIGTIASPADLGDGKPALALLQSVGLL
jgi:iron(III) transport system substrate-binding protein